MLIQAKAKKRIAALQN